MTNLYGYGGGDPVNRIDPDGHNVIVVVLTVVSVATAAYALYRFYRRKYQSRNVSSRRSRRWSP